MALEEIREKPLDDRIVYWRKMLGCDDAKSLTKYMVRLAPVTTDAAILLKRGTEEKDKAEHK